MSEDYEEIKPEIVLGKAFSTPDLGNLAKALAAAQLELVQPKKTKEVDITLKSGRRVKYKYAELPGCIESIKVLNKHGIAVLQPLSVAGDILSITTTLIHETGEYLGSVCSWTLTDPDPKNAGSLITYLRRYALSVAGVAAEEDTDSQTHMESSDKASKESSKKPIGLVSPVAMAHEIQEKIKNGKEWEIYTATNDQKITLATEADKMGISAKDKKTLGELSTTLIAAKVPMSKLKDAISEFMMQ